MAGTLNFERARFNMVEQQVRPWEVLNPRVLDILGEVKREDFVPPRHRKLAFADLPIPLDHGEFMMKPVVEGRLLQALELTGDEEVLEIGTGSGFMTACLARLARQVSRLSAIPISPSAREDVSAPAASAMSRCRSRTLSPITRARPLTRSP